MFSVIFSIQVTATIVWNGIALAERYDGRQVRKSFLGQQFIIMKIAEAQVCSLNTWQLTLFFLIYHIHQTC